MTKVGYQLKQEGKIELIIKYLKTRFNAPVDALGELQDELSKINDLDNTFEEAMKSNTLEEFKKKIEH